MCVFEHAPLCWPCQGYWKGNSWMFLQCFWMFLAASRHHHHRQRPGQRHRHRQATDGSFWTASVPPLTLSLPLCHSVSVSLPPLARQPRVCLSPAIAAVQMAPGISIIYRLWKPFTFVIYAVLTATGSLHSAHTYTHTHTLGDAYFDIQVKLVTTNTNTNTNTTNRNESHNKIIKWNFSCFFLLLSLSNHVTVLLALRWCNVIIRVLSCFSRLDFIIWQSFITYKIQ